MKNRLSAWLTALLVAALVLGAVAIGGVKGYKEDREALLIACMETHAQARDMQESIRQCEENAAEFDAQLDDKLMGRIAGSFGVEPISQSVRALHAQLQREAEAKPAAPSLTEQIEDLLDDHVDTSLSLGKVIWTCILLSVIFGKKGRRRGFSLGKLLAGFGLFKMWRKD